MNRIPRRITISPGRLTEKRAPPKKILGTGRALGLRMQFAAPRYPTHRFT